MLNSIIYGSIYTIREIVILSEYYWKSSSEKNQSFKMSPISIIL